MQDGVTFLSLPQQDNPELLSYPTHTANTVSSSASGGESLHSDPLVTPPSDSVAGLHFSPAKSKSSSGNSEFCPRNHELLLQCRSEHELLNTSTGLFLCLSGYNARF